jgi:hypothetical protein
MEWSLQPMMGWDWDLMMKVEYITNNLGANHICQFEVQISHLKKQCIDSGLRDIVRSGLCDILLNGFFIITISAKAGVLEAA